MYQGWLLSFQEAPLNKTGMLEEHRLGSELGVDQAVCFGHTGFEVPVKLLHGMPGSRWVVDIWTSGKRSGFKLSAYVQH